MQKLLIAAFVVTSSLVVACSAKSTGTSSTADSNASDNSDANEAAGSAAQTSDLEQTLLGSVASADPGAAAGSVAAAQWWPAGCATRTKDASNPFVVHVHLDNCTGPFGIRQHTGDITVTFSKNPDASLHAEAASANMTINGKPVTFSARRDITVAAGIIDVKGHAAWTREDAAGDTVSHTTSVETKIDVAKKCRTSNGTAVTTIGTREVDSTLTDYEVCRNADGSDACPTGTLSHTHKATGRTVSVSFDGSNQATITGPKGGTVEVTLVCGT